MLQNVNAKTMMEVMYNLGMGSRLVIASIGRGYIVHTLVQHTMNVSDCRHEALDSTNCIIVLFACNLFI